MLFKNYVGQYSTKKKIHDRVCTVEFVLWTFMVNWYEFVVNLIKRCHFLAVFVSWVERRFCDFKQLLIFFFGCSCYTSQVYQDGAKDVLLSVVARISGEWAFYIFRLNLCAYPCTISFGESTISYTSSD